MSPVQIDEFTVVAEVEPRAEQPQAAQPPAPSRRALELELDRSLWQRVVRAERLRAG
jgi:hypothetical protein